MEDIVVRLIKAASAVVILSFILGNVFGQDDLNETSLSAAVQADTNGLSDISAYYGFGEMELVKLDWGIRGLKTADFDGDGRGDIAIVNDTKSRIDILIQKAAVGPGEKSVTVDPNEIDLNQITPPTRFQRQSVAVSQKIYSFVCGDLNGDKMVDLAFYGEPKGLYVMLQKAAELDPNKPAEPNKPKTLSWQTRKKIKIDDGLANPNALVCADLNNDGADDLVLAGRDGVYIILQKDGSLAEPVKYSTTAQILGIDVGDLNGDGIKDLVLLTSDTEKPLHIRFGLKTGQLGPEEQFFIENPYVLELCDIDGRPGDEILTVDARSGRLICYKYSGEKEKDSDWPSLFYPLQSGEGNTKRDLVVADFDGDGLPDVVISDPGAAELIFYKQAKGLGLGEPVRFPAFADIDSLSQADIDKDGKTELAVLSVKEKTIGLSRYANDRLWFPKPMDLIGEPLAMELADIDGDENFDCVYVSKDVNDISSLRVISNIGNRADLGTEKQEKKDKAKAKGKKSKGDEAASNAPALKLKKLPSNPDGLKVLDVDQDGLQDVLIFIKYEQPMLIRQTSKGVFELVDSPKAQASLIKDAAISSIAVADIDGLPGKELLVTQKNFARSLVFAKGQTWTIIDQYNAKSTDNAISAVGVFDVDSQGPDGRPAIMLLDGQKGQLQILKAGTDKTYRFEKELDVGRWNAASHFKFLFAPLTGDTIKSILLFDGDKFALVTPPNAGEVRHHLEQLFSYETKIKDGVYGNMTSGDINGDGKPDIVMVEYKNNHIEIVALDSDNKPVPAMRFKIFEEKSYREKREKASVEPREMKVADVTGDGKNDLVTVIHDRIIIYPQD
jgi:hypothetical protein